MDGSWGATKQLLRVFSHLPLEGAGIHVFLNKILPTWQEQDVFGTIFINIVEIPIHCNSSGRWFQIFLFSPLFGEDSHFYYIIFFKWVETTNQSSHSCFSVVSGVALRGSINYSTPGTGASLQSTLGWEHVGGKWNVDLQGSLNYPF